MITQRNKAITLWSWAQCLKWNDPIQEQYWQITHFKIHISRKALWKDVSAVTANSTTWELWLSAFIAPIKYAMLHRKFVAKHSLNYCLLNWEHSSWESNSQFVESNNKSSITPFCCIVFSQDPRKETISIHFFTVFVSSVCNEMSLQARIMNNLLLSVCQFLHFPARQNSHWYIYFFFCVKTPLKCSAPLLLRAFMFTPVGAVRPVLPTWYPHASPRMPIDACVHHLAASASGVAGMQLVSSPLLPRLCNVV